MPTIGQEFKGCRYWGFELSSCSEMNTGSKTREERRGARERYNAEWKTVKLAGYKAMMMGLTKHDATQRATALEVRFPGIKWKVFNHDYL